MDRKPASSIRAGLASARIPASPHTPQHRTASSAFSSPSTSFRQEEDAVIIELGARYLRAGFEGENVPQCCLTFGPSDSRRVGDFRDCLPEYAERTKLSPRGQEWGTDYELWQMDMRDVDLGLVGDKLERAVREAYTKHLLTDPGSQRLVLVLPSVMPHRLLELIMTTLFSHFRYHGVMLLQQPTMCAVAAGLRSALVVDIGWVETIVTAIYEYRECYSIRSIRSMKHFLQEVGKLLSGLNEVDDADRGSEQDQGKLERHVTLELCEDVATRLAWCHAARTEGDVLENIGAYQVSIPLSAGGSAPMGRISITKLAEPAERTFFSSDPNDDDNEQPLHFLIYKALLSLPRDIRGTCMSRIIVTGGGAKVPGLKKRVMDEVSHLVDRYGWDSRRGNVVDSQREKLKEISRNRPSNQDDHNGHLDVNGSSTEQTSDLIEEKLQRTQLKDTPSSVNGVLRQVESLGSWAGASLIASLRVKGVVEVDRDKFLLHGLAGASREVERSSVPQRASFGAPGMSERSNWTLGAWA